MAIVTVDQTLTPTTAKLHLGAFEVQRDLRNAASKAAIINLMAQGVDYVTQHWSGGLSNANSGAQNWSQTDLAPVSMATPRQWASASGSRQGLDPFFANMDALIALRPNVKVVLVLFDQPEAVVGGATRTVQGGKYVVWSAVNWTLVAQLCTEVLARYPGRIVAISFGQEFKGLVSRTDVTALNNFVAGYTTWATYMRTNHPAVKLYYPHLNFWSTESSVAIRNAAMDALLAGGTSFATGDEQMLARLLTVNPALVDGFTIDNSIVDYNDAAHHTDYNWMIARTHLERETVRLLRVRLATAGFPANVDIHAIESYFAVNQGAAILPADQQAALSTSILMHALDIIGIHNRWGPQGGDATNPNMASWWDNNAGAFPAWLQARDLVNALPAGTGLHPTTCDDASIQVRAGTLAGVGKLYLLNKSAGAISVTASSADGHSWTMPVQSVPAYGYVPLTLPPPPVALTSALDAFGRTVSGGLGNADTGGTYTLLGSGANYGVAAGVGTAAMAASATRAAVLLDVEIDDGYASIDRTVAALPVGASMEYQVGIRCTSTSPANLYRAVMILSPAGTCQLQIERWVAGARTTLPGAGPIAIPMTLAAGQSFRLIIDGRGFNPTLLGAKAFRLGTLEPQIQVTASDSSAGLQVPGGPWVGGFLNAGASALTDQFDNLVATTDDLPVPPPPPSGGTGVSYSDYFANAQLNDQFGGPRWTPPAIYYVQLFVANPGPAGTGAATVLQRIPAPADLVNFTSAALRQAMNGIKWSWGSTAGQLANQPATWIGLFDAPVAGNLIEYTPLVTPLPTADRAEVAIQAGGAVFQR